MSAVDSIYRLPPSLREDLEQLRRMTEQFKAGAIPATRYQAFRVPQGIYEQRENGSYMLRVRLPAGIFLPAQMRITADVARKHGNGTLHLTSRQDIQVHGVSLDHIYLALVELADAGLSTKGGGGNTVRNIAACRHAGVCEKEVFDVTSHVLGLTEFMLPDPLSYQLPRKYKIAFSGCSQDCAGATINDLGFISKRRDDIEGFAVYVGGGMGASSRVARRLEEFVAASEVCRVAEAVKRVFDKHGNRKNKHRARLRFLLEDVGFEVFRDLYRHELSQLPDSERKLNGCENSDHVAPASGLNVSDPEIDMWRRASVMPQKQVGFNIVEISPALGILDAEQLRQLAAVVEQFGERRLRATNRQNFVLRWVGEGELAHLHTALSELKLAPTSPHVVKHVLACAGASTCRLGICLSRGLATAITAELARADLDARNSLGLSVHISGCPNACGRHPVADVGFFGAARRVNGHLVPHYVLQLGGHVEESKTVLASGNTPIPARNIPHFLVDFLQAFRSSAHFPNFPAFLDSGGRAIAEKIAQAHGHVPAFEEDKNHYFDWDAREVFSLAGRGPGECGAGVFDLIEVDLASAAEAFATGRRFAATVLAARALLVTRGEQAENDRESLTLFQKHFVEQDQIPPVVRRVISAGQQALGAADPESAIGASNDDVAALIEFVRSLYASLDPSLRSAAPPKPAQPASDSSAALTPDMTVDFRGVDCPLNYVKTKMALAKMRAGQTLSILLDQRGAQNVPASAANDGHQVLAVSEQGEHWRVLIRKAVG